MQRPVANGAGATIAVRNLVPVAKMHPERVGGVPDAEKSKLTERLESVLNVVVHRWSVPVA